MRPQHVTAESLQLAEQHHDNLQYRRHDEQPET